MDDDLCFHLVEAAWRVAFLCFILSSNREKFERKKETSKRRKEKKKGKVNEILIIEAVTQPSTEMYFFLIPQSEMGCTHAAIQHYLDMLLRAEALRSLSNHLRIIIPTLHLGKQVPRE